MIFSPLLAKMHIHFIFNLVLTLTLIHVGPNHLIILCLWWRSTKWLLLVSQKLFNNCIGSPGVCEPSNVSCPSELLSILCMFMSFPLLSSLEMCSCNNTHTDTHTHGVYERNNFNNLLKKKILILIIHSFVEKLLKFIFCYWVNLSLKFFHKPTFAILQYFFTKITTSSFVDIHFLF